MEYPIDSGTQSRVGQELPGRRHVGARIFIGVRELAGGLGIGLHSLSRHMAAMSAAGVVEYHYHDGRRYPVATAHALRAYWASRRFD